jgi:Protein of unknown function (DUF3303)
MLPWGGHGTLTDRGRMAGYPLTGGAVMKCILTCTLSSETRDAAMARFFETGGQPPLGVRLLGRWTPLDLCGGFVLLKSEGPQAVTAFAYAWNDVVELTTAPVLEDEDLADVLQRASTQPAQMDGRPEELPCTAPGVSVLVTARRSREETRWSSPM